MYIQNHGIKWTKAPGIRKQNNANIQFSQIQQSILTIGPPNRWVKLYVFVCFFIVNPYIQIYPGFISRNPNNSGSLPVSYNISGGLWN